ncbi:chromate resistance protein ChrB domain-containing protein [Noviherbaspirillum massiliense]|uniref:chromate resistance protein ChrB domain-containing protein n=1 Tax=Noviherbaspirillum massiliense TaxID=1465823 RepID=UPI0004753384|nr:chromate resistance protein ChrB domain-containing protein [Noviherbaspirillum massiliense]
MSVNTTTWLLLVATLPTASTTARMRLWRGIKALGCATLRDGVYLLPEGNERAVALAELASQTNAEGGQAWLMNLSTRSADDEAAFHALFNRAEDYAELAARLAQARKALAAQGRAEIARTVKRLRRELEAIQRIDFFPNDASLAAQAAWADFQEIADTFLSPDEPHAEMRPIPRLDRARYQGRTWATRRHLWVDRVASAWLIKRFIDREARFLWLDSPAHCPPDALGFDFDDAAFTHVGDKVTFEVLLESFGLENDRGLSQIASLVHFLDVGGTAHPEATGFEAILSGARERLRDDDDLLREFSHVLDSLHRHYSKETTT